MQGSAKWDTLFQPFPFFTQYKNYIMVEVGGATEEAHVKWEGWVQSRLRFLMSNIQTYTMGNLLLHPWPFEITDKATPHTSYFFLGLHRRPQVGHLLQRPGLWALFAGCVQPTSVVKGSTERLVGMCVRTGAVCGHEGL